MASIFTDYFIEPGGDLHTFIWQGQSIVLGYKNYSDSFFSYTNIDIHDSVVIDSFGRTATWRGSPYSANLCYDRATEDLYIIYLDYPDTQSGVTSVEAIKLSGYPPIFNDSIITLIPNADAYVVETGKYVDDEGFIHIALVSGTQDSIYYKKINPNLAGIDILNNKKNAKQHAKNFIYVQNIISSEGIVSFELANDNAVEINLFDSSGRFVKTIADKFFKEGSHNLPFTADGFKQGIYFISLKINSDRITKKLIVMK
ncbi:TPA: hypothetical protein DCW38_01990 [candidate division WOR-3 bacterium]|uniref:Uncharacterized protein n=1 Tax=candidate division WOR-3 bacterium TaxID=2052148 RepID=A0A350H8S0_UNCW3|nr:hypothetical protein [candidate division WOR-3 bacterium]